MAEYDYLNPYLPAPAQPTATGQMITQADLIRAYRATDPDKVDDVERLWRENGFGASVDVGQLIGMGSPFVGASRRSIGTFQSALGYVGPESEARAQEQSILEALFGFGEQQFGISRDQLQLARDYFSKTSQVWDKMLGYADEQATRARELYGEALPLRRSLIAATLQELGLPIPAGYAAPTTQPSIFRPNIKPELQNLGTGMQRARSEILATSPARGGMLNRSLSELPLERERGASGLRWDAQNQGRARALATMSGIGMQAPELLYSGLQGAMQGTGAAGSGFGSMGNANLAGAGTFAGLGGNMYGMGANLFSNARNRDMQQQLALTELGMRDRFMNNQMDMSKGGGKGQLLSPFLASAGSQLGKSAGSSAASGLARLGSSALAALPTIFSCWVAAAIYGPRSEEFWLAREWIFQRWQGTEAAMVRALYLRYGPAVAERVKRDDSLRVHLKPFFDWAVRMAWRARHG